jgi:hypothetical protein
MKLVGQRLFLPGDGAYKGITVVDVSDATDPQVEAIWLADVPVSGVAIADGLLFTTERTQGMASYVLPPAAPSVPMFGGAASVGLAGAIAAGAWMRLRIRRHRA